MTNCKVGGRGSIPSRSKTMFWLAFEPGQSRTHWVPGALSLGVKWPRHAADPRASCYVEVWSVWSITAMSSVHQHALFRKNLPFLFHIIIGC
jgi:hypothetical protein